jgi:hypothetical protein
MAFPIAFREMGSRRVLGRAPSALTEASAAIEYRKHTLSNAVAMLSTTASGSYFAVRRNQSLSHFRIHFRILLRARPTPTLALGVRNRVDSGDLVICVVFHLGWSRTHHAHSNFNASQSGRTGPVVQLRLPSPRPAAQSVRNNGVHYSTTVPAAESLRWKRQVSF